MKALRTACLLTFIAAAQTVLAQGIVITQTETRSGKTTNNTIQLTKTQMRAETRATGDATAVTFDANSKAIRTINLDKKTYSEIDSNQIARMQKEMSQMMEQLKNMPPEQRTMMENMMKGRGMPGMGTPAAKIEYKQAGSDKAGKWSCTKYEGYRGADKVVEVCTVDPKELGVTPADFDIMKQMVEFMRTLAPQISDQMITAGGADVGYNGIPVRQSFFIAGKLNSTNEIQDIVRQDIPASVFAVPAGFKRER